MANEPPQQSLPVEQPQPILPSAKPYDLLNWLKLLILAAIVLFVVAIVATAPAPDSTTNWKVYANSYYLYQISVPNDWIIEEVDYQNWGIDPIVRLSSSNKEIVISSRGDDVFLANEKEGYFGGAENYSDGVVDMGIVQVGSYTIPRMYELYSTISGDKQAHWININAYKVPHPSNIEIPSFRILIKGDLEKNDSLIIEILRTFKNTGTLKSLEDLMEYSIPPGWHQGKFYIESPDYMQAELGYEKGKGIGIGVSRSFSLPGHTLESEKNSWKETAGTSDISNATINGLPALKFHIDYEGHSLLYYVIKDGYAFTISFFSPDLTEEKKYQREIDEFLTSVRFK